MAQRNNNGKSIESWIWDAACSIRGAKDAPKYKDFILPLIFTKRLCDVYDDELNRIAAEVGSLKKAFQLARRDHKLVRFYLPLVPNDPEHRSGPSFASWRTGSASNSQPTCARSRRKTRCSTASSIVSTSTPPRTASATSTTIASRT